MIFTGRIYFSCILGCAGDFFLTLFTVDRNICILYPCLSVYVTILPLCSFYSLLLHGWILSVLALIQLGFLFPLHLLCILSRFISCCLLISTEAVFLGGSLFKSLDVDVSNLSFLFFTSCL